MEDCDHDQYMIKVYSSGRFTRRNRQFLRKYNLKSHFSLPPAPQEVPVPEVEDTETDETGGDVDIVFSYLYLFNY